MKKNYIAPEFEELLIDSSDDILKSLEEEATDDLLNGLPGVDGNTGTTDWENNENQGGGTDDEEDDFVDVTP